jgi:hypothetical protein
MYCIEKNLATLLEIKTEARRFKNRSKFENPISLNLNPNQRKRLD